MPATHYTADATLLPRQFNFAGGATINVQWHHIINTVSFTQNSALLNAIGWDNNLISKNLVPLASDAASATVLGTARHSGGHAPYNRFINDTLAILSDEYDRRLATGNLGTFLDDASRQINGLVAYLKVELTAPDSKNSGHLQFRQSRRCVVEAAQR